MDSVGITFDVKQYKILQTLQASLRPILFNLFVNDYGLGVMMIDHYYLTGRKQSDEFITDPIQRAHWIHQHLPYMSGTANYIRQIRNKVVHRIDLSLNLFSKLVTALEELLKHQFNICELIQDLYDQMILVVNVSIGNIGISAYKECPIYKNTHGNSIKIIEKEYLNLVTDLGSGITMNIPLTITPNSFFTDKEYPLSYIKTTPLKEYLKGQKIKIKSGIYKDNIAILKGWNGTKTVITMENLDKRSIRNDILICIPKNMLPMISSNNTA